MREKKKSKKMGEENGVVRALCMHVVVGVGWERILCFTVPPTRQADNMQVHIHMTYPLLVLESAPITTPPLYSTAMMEVLGGGRGKESELLATTMHTTNQVLVFGRRLELSLTTWDINSLAWPDTPSLMWPDPIFAPRKRIWNMAIQQFVAWLHCGICTNHSGVFSHMLTEVINAKFECE